ncbi:MAG: transposase [Candidatus Marinimicrobia bacterium]|nr:transposase [Candidatus Neomarinimicrobiota bacterium]
MNLAVNLAMGLLLRSHFSLDNSINIVEYNYMTRNRYRVFESDYPYSITCTVIDWLDLIKHDVIKQIIIDSLRFLRDEKVIKIFAFVIMHNHLHLILSSENLSRNICRFKSFTAKQIIKHYKNIGEIKVIQKLSAANPAYHRNCEHHFWQEGYCPKQIMS